ncbi:uncharacterized protein LOC124419612 [Lucilia cuprina]|uniref:uncharacterized protein LOC124419575 n=1 Tax=Lucilia cuprina TaxID=7375 RepID=UPI001F0634B2|nr:uncharacterized protein LOC124419575 [Lucilia cuprina]XP_046805609.1 uncharacterized protein LOC124419584 [Lucilia cuprina]XP_046805740.1 uncharacterized protein LOC124419612 [Lucilia cuprina]
MNKMYVQKFRKEWLSNEKFKDWIKESEDSGKAFCIYCKCDILAKFSCLEKHAETKKHESAIGYITKNKPIPFKPVSFKLQQQEAALCMYIAVHSSIKPVDHLGELCKAKFDCASIKLHRTKCSKIIKNVLGPHFNEELTNDIGNSYYSILIDESTDVSFTKTLGLAIIYFSQRKNVIVSTFLNIEEIPNGTAESIVISLKDTLQKFKLNINKLVGIGTDNANVMIGKNKSVHVALKKDVPDLVLVKCVCHSLQLAVNQSLKDFLPTNLEFIVYETFNWFSKSSNRQQSYKTLYENLNGKEPLKITRISDTRWLSVEIAVVRILFQWDELKLHFEMANINEKCHKAKILYEMYRDETIHLYLLFLKPVLHEIQIVNKVFQSNENDPTRLLKEITLLINFLKKKYSITKL